MAAATPAASPPQAPNTPVSPNTPAPPPAAPAPAPAPPSPQAAKRKPSRRANTAERRATHNAVERQRRETLNGRFLDLAALLPNLSQIRRPSKSSIVNSSIAHIHASRRHRMLASRELRLLKLEADALRRELNEWRERANIPRIEEPVRGEGFSMIISGELEVILGVPGPNEDDDDDDEPLSAGPGGHVGYGGYVGGDGSLPDDDYDGMDVMSPSNPGTSPTVPPYSVGLDDPRMLAVLKHLPPNTTGAAGLPHILPRPANAPTNVPAFDALYEHYPPQGLPHHTQMMQHHHAHAAYLQQQQQQEQQHAHAMREREREHHVSREREREREMHIREQRERAMQHEKMWTMYGPSTGGAPPPPSRSGGGGSFPPQQQQQWQPGPGPGQPMMMQAQRSLFTPPATSHGLPTPSPTGTHASGNGANNVGSPASSVSGDEAAGVGVQRARSGSGSGSERGSHSPSYELGAGVGMGALGMSGEYVVQYHGHGHVGVGGGVPRMGGGMMGMEMAGMMGVGC
ncbi:hypothetical protein C0995_014267 [Termitomyces sp. Mi166|nr:hypothetical protein C0995_014267 [Termitomyces sp. Mi166\